jgi:hypothetical protein
MRMANGSGSRRRGGRWGRRVLYWLAVTVVSIVLVVMFLVLLQSQDSSTVDAVALGWA